MKKVIGLGVALLIAGLIGFKYYQAHNPQAKQELAEVVAQATIESTSSNPQPAATPTANVRSVNIDVARPVDGVNKGVIEVGASGFNAFVVTIDKQKNWELISKKFGKSLAYEGFATTDDVWKQMKDYIEDMVTTKGVNGKNVHFVISSGAMKNPKTELIAQAIKEKGFVVNKVTAEEEGKDALRALLPKAYRDNSFVVDIGSGNTKISWYQGVSMKSIEASGAKYAQLNKTDAQVKEEIIKAVQQVPQDKRAYCFIIGGVPHQLAEQTRQGEERFTTLQSPDFYSAGDDAKVKAGLNIYSAVIEGSGTNSVVFDWDANFTIGFLLTLN